LEEGVDFLQIEFPWAIAIGTGIESPSFRSSACRTCGSLHRGSAARRRSGASSNGTVQGFSANLALSLLGTVVCPAHGAQDKVEDVFDLGDHLRFHLELGRAPRTPRISLGHESAAVCAEEEESVLPSREDIVDVLARELLRMTEALLEELQGLLAVDAEGSGEADDCLVDDEGPAIAALRLVRGHRLLADGTQGPGRFPGHRLE
jgi:hypothetical protein